MWQTLPVHAPLIVACGVNQRLELDLPSLRHNSNNMRHSNIPRRNDPLEARNWASVKKNR
jgi:hypothetical protein